jgi:hypothetical protein
MGAHGVRFIVKCQLLYWLYLVITFGTDTNKENNLQLKQSPYNLLLYAALVLISTSFFIDQNKTADIHVHDTYFIIAQTQLYWLFACIIWVLWFLYLTTRKLLYSKSLTWTHVVITLFTVVFLNFLLYFGNDLLYQPAKPFVDSWKAYDANNRNKRLIEISVLVLVIGQITFIVNLVAGLFKRTRGLHQ